MRYLITTNVQPPALTEWFIPENNFNADVDMTVFDLALNKYTTDGETWQDITIDHL